MKDLFFCLYTSERAPFTASLQNVPVSQSSVYKTFECPYLKIKVLNSDRLWCEWTFFVFLSDRKIFK